MPPVLVLDDVRRAVGPFAIPVALFALGVVGYGLLHALARLGVLDR